jgi:hypothetical protein
MKRRTRTKTGVRLWLASASWAAALSALFVPATTSASEPSRLPARVQALAGQRGSVTPADPDPRFVPGQVIVRFRSAATPEGRGRARAAVDAHVAKQLPLPHTELLELGPGQGVRDAAAALERREDVAYAQPNFIRHAQATPNDPYFTSLWGLDNTGQIVKGCPCPGNEAVPDADIDAPEAWDRETGSASTVVAVVDTGVGYTHDDLKDNLWSNPDETPGNGIDDDGNGKVDDVHGWDFVAGDNAPIDETDTAPTSRARSGPKATTASGRPGWLGTSP